VLLSEPRFWYLELPIINAIFSADAKAGDIEKIKKVNNNSIFIMYSVCLLLFI
jgi:hypothetical protein